MPQAHADLRIDARLIVPMSARETLLEHHSVMVRDGRITEVLPTADAAQRYTSEVHLERPTHLLLPGLIDANAEAGASLLRQLRPHGTVDGSAASEQWVRDGVQYATARMLRAGTTCFADRYFFPDVLARTAVEQGLRVHIGLPVADTPSPWAKNFNEYLSRALALRDEFRAHPLVSTAFAPLDLPDAQFARLATIADELEASLVMDVQRSEDQLARSLHTFGQRPLSRLQRLGVLTPSFIALHMNLLDGADLELARAGGIASVLCPHQSVASGQLPPIRALAAAGMLIGLGSGEALLGQSLWAELRLAALALGDPYRALAAVTCDAAALLGIGAQAGTIAAGRWADLCCVELGALPALSPQAALEALVLGEARDLVSDVWVAGRQLVAEAALTRLDWPALAARANTWRPKHAGNG